MQGRPRNVVLAVLLPKDDCSPVSYSSSSILGLLSEPHLSSGEVLTGAQVRPQLNIAFALHSRRPETLPVLLTTCPWVSQKAFHFHPVFHSADLSCLLCTRTLMHTIFCVKHFYHSVFFSWCMFRDYLDFPWPWLSCLWRENSVRPLV